MGVEFKFRCETCGAVFDSAENVITHLLEVGNEHHIIDEEYVRTGSSGVPTNFVMRSPNGTVWKVWIDDNGVLITDPV